MVNLLPFLVSALMIGTNTPTDVRVGTNLVQTVRVGTNLVWQRNQDVTDGLVAWWKMDDGAGTNATDSIGGNNAFFVDAPAWTNRGASGALYFDGVNDALKATGLDLSATNIVTLAFWLRWDAYEANYDLAFEYGSTYSVSGFTVDPNADQSFELLINKSGGLNGGTISRPSQGVWHHYGIVWNRTTGTSLGITVYIDGVPISVSQTASDDIGDNFASASSGGLNFMSRNGVALFGNGALDDVRIYNRTLTSNEVKQIWSATK